MTKEKKYKDFDQMKKGHQILSYKEIKDLKEKSLSPFIEEEEDGDGHIFACMESGRLLVDILEKHNLHVITMSIFDGDSDEEDEDEVTPCTYRYSTGFHWVNRERYYLCRKKSAAFCEEEF